MKQLKLQAVLCINKIDRLFQELHMTPQDAYTRVLEVIADVNAAFGKNKFSFAKNVFLASSLNAWGFDCFRAAEIVQALCPEIVFDDIELFEEMIAAPNAVLTANGVKEGNGPSVMSMVLGIVDQAYKNDVKTIRKYSKKIDVQLSADDKDYCLKFLKQAFPLSRTVFDEILWRTSKKENNFIAELRKIEGVDSLLVCSKALNRNEVDIPYEIAGNLAICRVIKMFESEMLKANSTFYDQKGSQITIVNIYQPFGKQLVKTLQQHFCSGCIVIIETDKLVSPDSILFEQFESQPKDAKNDDILGALEVKSSDSVTNMKQPALQFTNQLLSNYSSILANILKFQQPLITVCFNAAKLSEYNALVDALQEYCIKDISCEFSISELGEVMLSVCGDVHLDLCISKIKDEYPELDFTISDSSFTLKETLSDEINTLPFAAYERLDEALFQLGNEIFSFLKNNDENDTEKNVTFLRNVPTIESYSQFELQYYREIGRIYNPDVNNVSGIELPVITENEGNVLTVTRYILSFVARESSADITESRILYSDDENNNFLYTNGDIPEILEQIITKAFKANMRQGPLCLEQMQDVTINAVLSGQQSCEIDLNDKSTFAEAIESGFKGHFISIHETIAEQYHSILIACRASIMFSTLKIKEPHLSTSIQCPEDLSNETMLLLDQFECKEIAIIDCQKGHMTIECFVPLRFALQFSKDIRSQCSGRASIEYLQQKLIILPEDPRKDIAGNEEEEIEFGKEGKGNNLATQVIRIIQEEKGLLIEEVVKDAEKERTIKKCR